MDKGNARYIDARGAAPFSMFNHHSKADDSVFKYYDRMIREYHLDHLLPRFQGNCPNCEVRVVTGCVACPGCRTLLKYKGAEVLRNPEDDWSKAPDP